MEHHVRQRSQEWYNLRKGKVVTGSRFADAIGVGKGKPYDFLRSLIDGRLIPVIYLKCCNYYTTSYLQFYIFFYKFRSNCLS